MDTLNVAAYLSRIGAEPGADLGALQLAHLRAVPFENLSIHLGEPIVLTEDALYDKIVQRRRGGFCYELNGAFAFLVTALGHHVSLHQARVHTGEGYGPPFDHLALRVDSTWLVDVGFGAFSHLPLRLDVREEQSDPAGAFLVTETGEGDLDVSLDGAPQYRLDPRPYALADFGPTCWWQQTSPESHFTRSLTCSRLTETGRITLSGERLITTADGERQEQHLGKDDILPAYQSHFGIALDRIPTVA